MEIETILLKIITKIMDCLYEIYSSESNNEFIEGEKTAYMECIEIIQDIMNTISMPFNFDTAETPLNKTIYIK